ncbi:MAG TPA: aminodeoxychorismate/anthranilate synthase component II [Bacteroidia bacterium]|nr:aminodeoxychorismate/anthranilate synthase component II [Bacteroidia bacterium]
MKVLIIDNYDSFTYNLYQMVGDLLMQQNKANVLNVCRNDKISLSEIKKNYNKIILSPGPGNPADKAYFGVCAEVLLNPQKDLPVLGVCLGMQGMAHYFGGKVVPSNQPMHGKTSPIKHDEKGVFKNIPQSVQIMRYHSLMVERESLPATLEITAYTNDTTKEIMGLRHKQYPIEGIQFHPESFATQEGSTMLKNFLFN